MLVCYAGYLQQITYPAHLPYLGSDKPSDVDTLKSGHPPLIVVPVNTSRESEA